VHYAVPESCGSESSLFSTTRRYLVFRSVNNIEQFQVRRAIVTMTAVLAVTGARPHGLSTTAQAATDRHPLFNHRLRTTSTREFRKQTVRPR
jgi:hypothetical protein